MSYQALYRVWRPQRFDELVGQSVITTTLKNAIITGQISHAYLFAGPRGTGKTSAAKIFAKAVNCPNAKDGEPCNQCEICKSITNGTLNDVIEIDAASNNGVDEIRDVRDKAKYAPTEAKYKVYIIDEVHMLSIGAFNALLKTLEEPPESVIFILATTEPHKIPATIISRTQRFDFKRIKPQAILDRMEYIMKQKGLKYDDRALKVIAKAAEGGMRDALSILDQTLSYGDDTVTYENALQVTGSVTKKLLHDYFTAVINKDVKTALVDVQKIFDGGKDINQFIDDMINYCQDILLYQQSPKMVEEAELGVLNDDFKQDAGSASDQLIYQIIEQLNDIQYQMHFSNHPDVYLEVLTVKIATLSDQPVSDNATNDSRDDQQIANLNQQIKSLQNQVHQLQQSTPKNVKISHDDLTSSNLDNTNKPNERTEPLQEIRPANVASIYRVLDQATRKDLNRMQDAWHELLPSLKVVQRSVLNVSEPVAASDSGVVINFNYSFLYQKAVDDKELVTAIGNGLSRIIGYAPQINFITDDQWKQLRIDYIQKHHQQHTSQDSNNDENQNDFHHNMTDGTDQSSKDTNNESLASDSELVDKATSLFGDDVINVKDD